MNVQFTQAFFGICEDLTDPYAATIPVAVLTLAELPDGRRLATIAGYEVEATEDSNPYIISLCKNFRERIKAMVDALDHQKGEQGEDGTLEGLMTCLHSMLRNNLHIYQINGVTNIKISAEDNRDVEPELAQITIAQLLAHGEAFEQQRLEIRGKEAPKPEGSRRGGPVPTDHRKLETWPLVDRAAAH